MKTVAILDYGMGNLHSAKKAFEKQGAFVTVTKDRSEILKASHVVLPGVGAFRDAIALLNETGLGQTFKEAASLGKPTLGICLGMQLMMKNSTEGGKFEGLGLFDGDVTLIKAGGLKVPHMGWNEVENEKNCPILGGISGRNFYFVHSYCAQDAKAEYAAGITTYSEPFASVVWDGKLLFGTQFHPEKSGEAGQRLISNFLALKGGISC